MLSFGTKQIISQILSNALRYGPAVHLLVNQELERWAAAGQSRIDNFSSWEGLRQVARGEEDSKASDEAQVSWDKNSGLFLPIGAEFTLGTMERMFKGRGMMSVLRLALNDAIASVLQRRLPLRLLNPFRSQRFRVWQRQKKLFHPFSRNACYLQR